MRSTTTSHINRTTGALKERYRLSAITTDSTHFQSGALASRSSGGPVETAFAPATQCFQPPSRTCNSNKSTVYGDCKYINKQELEPVNIYARIYHLELLLWEAKVVEDPPQTRRFLLQYGND